MNDELINKITTLCDENSITISGMLKKCELPSSTFDNLKKGSKPSYDKITKIADYFGVSVDYLLGREESETVSDTELKFALFNGDKGISDEQLNEVKRFAEFIKKRDEKN